MIRPLAGILAAVLLALGGCGYSLRGTLPGHLQTVAVPVFANRTSQPAVEQFLTRAVVEAFSTNGRLRVVRPEVADSVLEGIVTGYDLQSIAFDAAANVRQYRLVVTLDLRYRDLKQDRVVFDRRGVQERADFRVPASVSETIAREETALRTAAVDIARAIVAFTVERF
jgi:hypothetical protein